MFTVVMNIVTFGGRQESYRKMFVDDIVIYSESREQVEEILDTLSYVLPGRGMKVSHSKTKYMCVNERQAK